MPRILLLTITLCCFVQSLSAQNIGVNTPTPNASLDVNGDMALRIANISLNAGINNNVNTSTTKRSTYRIIDPTADFTITGLDGGVDGRVITLVNTTAFVMTLIHESANSTGINRFTLTNGVSYDVRPKATITLQYSQIENRWFLTGSGNLEAGDWKLTGNAGTNITTNFFGTTDNVPLSFRQNNKWIGRLNATDRIYAFGGGAAETLLAGTTDNIAIGDSAMNGITNVQNLIAIGSKTARNPFGNNNSIAIGTEAGRFGMSSNSVAIGYQSQKGVAPGGGGSFNTSLGAGSLSANSLPGNTAIGYNNLKANVASENTGVGYRALENHATGDYNVAIGSVAMQNHKTGQENTVIGSNAMTNDTLGTANVAIGFGTLFLKNNRSGLVAIGHSALRTNGNTATLPTEAIENTAVGFQALQANNKGSYNTAVGSNAMPSTVNGNNNTAVGKRALSGNSNGNANTALGSDALSANASNNNNTAIGYQSQYSNNGSNNTSLGFQSLYNPSTGSSNVAIGTSALYNNFDKSNIIAIGDSALYNNGNGLTNASQAIQNTAIGSKALYANVLGSQNTVLGYNGLINNTNGKNNIAIGVQTLGSNVLGNNNVAIGDSAAFNTTAGNNVAIGKNSLFTNSTGTNNLAIGYNSNVGSNNLTNASAIGANAIVRGPNSLVLGSIAGLNGASASTFVGIGTPSPAFPLEVQSTNNNSTAGIYNYSQTGSGLYAQAEGTAIRAISNLGSAIVGINNSNTQPTASLQNGNSSGTTLETNGKNIFYGTTNHSIFYNGTNEDTYIRGGKANSKLFLNDLSTGEIQLGGGGLYSPNATAGFNMVPLGIVGYYVEGGLSTSAGYNNYAGNLVDGETHWVESNIISSSGFGIKLHLNPTVVSQYSKIIAIGNPNFIGQANAISANSVIVGFSQHFNPGSLVDIGHPPIPDEVIRPTNYENFTIEVALEDFSQIESQYLHGTVIFYGIK